MLLKRFHLLKRLNIKLEKRLRELENKLLANRVTLYFGDGSTRQILGDTDYLIDLLISASGGGQRDCGHAADLELIRSCVKSKEANGGHMVELIQCLLIEPAEEAGCDIQSER